MSGGPTIGQRYANPIASPLYRQGPWLSDSRIIGHVTHPLISRLITLAPRDGMWTIGPNGGTRIKDNHIDLVGFMDRATEHAIPCTLGADPETIHRYAEVDNIDTVPAYAPVVDVIASDGTLHAFDSSLIHLGLTCKPDRFGYHVENGMPVLVMFDRKDRARFVCCGLKTSEATS